MECRGCGSSVYLNKLWTDHDSDTPWYRCELCGSDTADRFYEDVKASYNDDFVKNVMSHGWETLLQQLDTNINVFNEYKALCPNMDFLDIGHNEGAMLHRMQSEGFSVHGFDVNPYTYLGNHTTIAEEFLASLFPQKYGAVNCREVLEHVPDWVKLLTEIHKVMSKGGVLQLQTPRPTHKQNRFGYNWQHLALISPTLLIHNLNALGFVVLKSLYWEEGQMHLCQTK